MPSSACGTGSPCRDSKRKKWQYLWIVLPRNRKYQSITWIGPCRMRSSSPVSSATSRRAASAGGSPRGGRRDGTRRPHSARSDPGDRLVLPIPRQDDPQVLPLLSLRVAPGRSGAASRGGDHGLRLVSAGGGAEDDLL